MSPAALHAKLHELTEAKEQDRAVVLIKETTVAPEDAGDFLRVLAEDTAHLRRQPGFVSTQLHTSKDGGGPYVSIVVWETAQALRNALRLPTSESLATRYPESATTDAQILQFAPRPHRFGEIAIEPAAREVRRRGELVRLTRKEYELLLALVTRPRRVLSREELMDIVWGYRAALETGTLTVHIRRLREKLEDNPAEPRHLQTVRGIGYRFQP